ncbi:hypothetical protein [Candidatus Phytoplasma citri]|uniref:Uncharacterized protein n=1 Tax=Candidatus Phytoplasma citri TaxID=180978 RepID=A0A1S9M0E0_9MOLU|nr:hypothetical protein [Candidatus Phytoplasma aurantifolia]MDO8060281.1 hypothetical protein [Candidatus Phytoplasma aurantifolia]MDO8078881.1 hypothetical protein [Candidatus Phytoplasma aurantifolia]OOP58569.1 hypothetical protein B2G44_01675 [Candidatus Phytoplasma aurantifolia]
MKLLKLNKFLIFLFLIQLVWLLNNNFSKLYAFDIANYEKDYNTKHNAIYWRHEKGHMFSDKAYVFYNLFPFKRMPCKTYQEFANTKQIIKNTTVLVSNLLFPFNRIFKVLDTVQEVTGDKYINDSDDQIAFINQFVKYFIQYYPEKGIFFFDPDYLKEISYVDITFCNCEMSNSLFSMSYDLLENFFQNEVDKIPYEDIFFNEASEIEMAELGLNLQNFYQKILENDFLKKRIRTQIIQKVKNQINLKILKIGINKTAKYVTSKLICNFLIPGTIESYEMFKQNHDATCNIDQNIRLYIKNNNLEKTLGFALHYNKVDNRVEIFSLEQNQLSSQLFSRLIQKINISDSTHMLVSLLQPKNLGTPDMNLNIYGGKLKKNLQK